jgi:hypothetical protein
MSINNVSAMIYGCSIVVLGSFIINLANLLLD